jgi:hypothetical protein
MFACYCVASFVEPLLFAVAAVKFITRKAARHEL